MLVVELCLRFTIETVLSILLAVLKQAVTRARGAILFFQQAIGHTLDSVGIGAPRAQDARKARSVLLQSAQLLYFR